MTIDRDALAGLADALIPSERGGPVADEATLPCASEAGVAGELLDQVLAVRPDLEEPLRAIADDARGRDPAAEVDRLRVHEPDLFEALGTVVAGGYFLSPDVKRRLGYPGQEALPLEDDADAELLRPVVERGPLFRRG